MLITSNCWTLLCLAADMAPTLPGSSDGCTHHNYQVHSSIQANSPYSCKHFFACHKYSYYCSAHQLLCMDKFAAGTCFCMSSEVPPPSIYSNIGRTYLYYYMFLTSSFSLSELLLSVPLSLLSHNLLVAIFIQYICVTVEI